MKSHGHHLLQSLCCVLRNTNFRLYNSCHYDCGSPWQSEASLWQFYGAPAPCCLCSSPQPVDTSAYLVRTIAGCLQQRHKLLMSTQLKGRVWFYKTSEFCAAHSEAKRVAVVHVRVFELCYFDCRHTLTIIVIVAVFTTMYLLWTDVSDAVVLFPQSESQSRIRAADSQNVWLLHHHQDGLLCQRLRACSPAANTGESHMTSPDRRQSETDWTLLLPGSGLPNGPGHHVLERELPPDRGLWITWSQLLFWGVHRKQLINWFSSTHQVTFSGTHDTLLFISDKQIKKKLKLIGIINKFWIKISDTQK